ncbi:MAG: hypothetical protein JKY11_04300 [Alphaproteobacteria bacterium]|nr:hypothetical protein [Alphaproteobacteria bacterium]
MVSDLKKLHIHYDVKDHFISMDNFSTASNAIQKIIDDLSKQVFGGRLRYQLVIIPPEEGTFLKTVGICTFIANVTLVPLTSDYITGVFEELTSHSPQYYASNHVRAIRDLTKGFLSKETEDLEKCIPRELNLDRAFKAKSDFYTSCQTNKKIRGLGFDDSKDFPIKSDHFKNYISKDKTRPLESDFVIYDAILTSPVTEDKNFQWDFEDTVTGQKISAYMHDESFKQDVLNGKYPIKQSESSDTLKILVEYQKQERNGEVIKRETCIKTVYRFNDVEITPILKDLPKGTKFQQILTTPMEKFWKH